MKQLQFSCTLLSDVVLSSQAATEGFHESLDYIPGAKFLGIVAKSLYDMENQQQTLDLFHNGCVRFGDAHPVGTSNVDTYKVPSSWQLLKGQVLASEKSEVYLAHRLSRNEKVALIDAGKKLEQARRGYFLLDGELQEVKQRFSIKSAYNSEEYRAKDKQMYGYFALKKGTKWCFEIAVDKEEYTDLIVTALYGKRHIGRSGSAEYGLVEIKLLQDTVTSPQAEKIDAGETYIYAVSNLCFYTDFGKTTSQPDPVQHLLLPEGSTILWEKSQIRTRRYMTWNKHRNNRDADRLIIEKGSVITVGLSKEINTVAFEKGIGAHRSEGFGKVWVNPDFLLSSTEKLALQLRKSPIADKTPLDFFAVEKRESDDMIIAFLSQKLLEAAKDAKVDKKVNEFVENNRDKFKDITSSQWGQIRNVAKHAQQVKDLEELLFNEQFGICMTGQSEPKWRGCRNSFKKFIFENLGLSNESKLDLTMKIAAEMAKAAQNKE